MERGLDKLINLKSKRNFQQKTSKTTFQTHLRPCFFGLGCPNLRPLVATPPQKKYLPRRFSEMPLIWWTCWSFRRQFVSDEFKKKRGTPPGSEETSPTLSKKGQSIDSKKCLFLIGDMLCYVFREGRNPREWVNHK